MTSFPAAPETLRRFLLPIVLLVGCGSRPLSNGSAGAGGDGISPTGNAGSSGAAGTGPGGTAGHGAAGAAGHGAAGAAGYAGSPGTVVVGDTGTIVFAPGSAVFSPREITVDLFRNGIYRCGPVPGYDPAGALAVSLLGFGVPGDPGCNLFISFSPVIPFDAPVTVFPGQPVMVSFTRGPNDEIVDPSFDVGGTAGAFGTGSITLDFGQGLRRAPVLTGGVTITLRAWPQRYGESIKYRVQAALADGGFLDFEVTKLLVAPTFVACPPCPAGQFCAN
jgi:hypothetical protein